MTTSPHADNIHTAWRPTRRAFAITTAVATALLLIAHSWHAGAPHGIPYAILGLTRLAAAVTAAVWGISEVVRWATQWGVAAINAHLDTRINTAVDQLRRELAEQRRHDISAIAGRVCDDLGDRIDAAVAHAHYGGYARAVRDMNQPAGDALPGGDVLRLPQRATQEAKHANGHRGGLS